MPAGFASPVHACACAAASIAVALAACGGAAARPRDPAPEVSTLPAARPRPAAHRNAEPWGPATADELALLRELAATADAAERLAAEHRLYVELLRGGPDAQAEARAIVERMLADPTFASWPRADEVLYDQGTLLAGAHQREQARAAWRRLVAEHPRSRLAADAHVALGDAAFEDADLAVAEAEYQLALRAPAGPVAAYARYKLGWVHVDLEQYAEALDDFVAVARSAPDPLGREAQYDALRAYAQVREPEDAVAFFDGVARGQGPALTARLASLYFDLGRFDDAAIAWRAAIPLLDFAGACRAAEGVAELARTAGPRAEVEAAQEALKDWSLAGCPRSP